MKALLQVGLLTTLSFSLPFSCNKTIVAKDSEVRTNGLMYMKGSTRPFKGKILEYHDAKKEKPKSTRRYKKGRLSGASEYWYQNGKKEAVREYVNGKLSGTVEEWYNDGAQKKKEEWLDGKRHGEWQTWKEDGKPKQAGVCEKGKDVEVYDFYTDGSKHLRYRKPGYEPED